ncbi:preprotein translocase subunit SecG [Pectinatus cerevisiiphilus]|uniref:Protein-export membrane protein SecG n=2 Tax=Pectinatus cerevisiiphilus TaxID=86956 RepID=A0A4R3K7P9_9FIRM|nr:preprotein translocase subunit SecG [Pectinatus cerevisiiphilus]
MKLTILMIIDAIIAIGLIVSVLMQEGKSAGMGGLSGETDTVFSTKARGLDALMAKVTVLFAILFGILTIIIAKMTA